MAIKKNNYCDWEFYYEGKNNKPFYTKCKICGRIKRSDLPDITPCAGSDIVRKSIMKKILGQDTDVESRYINYEEDNIDEE